MSVDLNPAAPPPTGARQRVLMLLRRWLGPRIASHDVADAVLKALGLDPTGAAGVTFRARIAAAPGALDDALHSLLGTEAMALAPPLMMRGMVASTPMPMVLSLGTHCYTSSLMRRWGLRQAAGPFDWLFSTVPMIAHVLDDDFRTFLDRSQYTPVPPDQRAAGPTANRVHHEYYRSRFGVEYVFNHHDAHLDADHAHFVRAVERFRQNLAATTPKLFLVTRWHALGFEQEMPALCEALAARTSNFRLLAFAVGGILRPAPYADVRRMDDGQDTRLAIYQVDPLSHWKPLEFENFADELPIAALVGQHLRSLVSDTAA